MSRPAILGLLVATGALFASPARAADRYDMAELARSKAAHPETEEAVASGAVLYRKHCASCHGDEGAGDGGAAAYLDPRPRDFTKSLFKFRSTKSGELPTDEDLFAMVSRGVAGTAMPAWGEGTFRLSVEERWQVSYFLKTFAEDFGDEAFAIRAQVAAPPTSIGGGELELRMSVQAVFSIQ